MTRFRNLLRFDPVSSPAEEQARAANEMPEAVERSNLQGWGRNIPHQGKYLLVAVAPYSGADLAFLDLLDDHIARSRAQTLPVYVHDLLEYANVEDLQSDFPGVRSANPTPLAALWESGSALRVESGRRARDMLAEVLRFDGGLGETPKQTTPDELLARIAEENLPQEVNSGPAAGREIP